MDPLSIISGCAGLITAIGSLSASINTFVRSCREARSDLDRVSRELHSLQTVPELIEEDAKDDTKPFPPTIQHHVSGIVTNCGSVVSEVETCIKKYGDGRIRSKAAWVINGQGDMEKLRSSLEAHKSALELALDMISLSLAKDIKTDTEEIRNDTAAIKDDTALILQEIAELQARLPDTATAPNNYILQKYLEDMATYTETTLETDLPYSDGMSSRALSIVIELDDSPPKPSRDGLQISGPQATAALVASQSPDSSNPGDALKNGIDKPVTPKSHYHGDGVWTKPRREDIHHHPKGLSPASPYPKYSYDKEVAPGSDPQPPRPSTLTPGSGNQEAQHQIPPSPPRVRKQSVPSRFALLDGFDSLWRERYGDYFDGKALSNDVIRDNQEFVISLLKEVEAKKPYYGQKNYPRPAIKYTRAQSEPSTPASPHTDSLNSTSLEWLQQLMPHMVPINRPVQGEAGEAVKSPPRTKYLPDPHECHILRFRGNVVVDIPAPDRILAHIPHSSPDRDEVTHSRFSFITCPPEEFRDQNYTLRATLFAKPRHTQFILVVQVNSDDNDFIRRWNLIHDSIVFAQEKLETFGGSSEFWKRVVVHLHLAHGTEWGPRGTDHPLSVLESIGVNQTISGKITKIDHEDLDEPVEKDSSAIGRHKVYATMSEYTVQLRQPNYLPGLLVVAEVPIQVVITTARVPESSLDLHWSRKYAPWTCAINNVLQAEHVIDMSVISHTFGKKHKFLWELSRADRHIPLVKYKPLLDTDLKVLRFDSGIEQIQADEIARGSAIEKKPKKRWARWLK